LEWRRGDRFNYPAKTICFMKTKVHQASKIATTFRCICKRKLILEEVRGLNIMMFGCDKCQCYVVVTPSKLREYVYSNRFSWQRFMRDLYTSYLEARRFICK
jgi:hypothetical protein